MQSRWANTFARPYKPPGKMVEARRPACNNCSLHAIPEMPFISSYSNAKSLPPSFRSMHTNELSSLLPFSTIHRILFISSLYAYTIERARFELLIADVRVLRKGSGFGSVDRVHGFVFNRQLSAASGHAATRPTRKKWLDWRDWRAKWSL